MSTWQQKSKILWATVTEWRVSECWPNKDNDTAPAELKWHQPIRSIQLEPTRTTRINGEVDFPLPPLSYQDRGHFRGKKGKNIPLDKSSILKKPKVSCPPLFEVCKSTVLENYLDQMSIPAYRHRGPKELHVKLFLLGQGNTSNWGQRGSGIFLFEGEPVFSALSGQCHSYAVLEDVLGKGNF